MIQGKKTYGDIIPEGYRTKQFLNRGLRVNADYDEDCGVDVRHALESDLKVRTEFTSFAGSAATAVVACHSEIPEGFEQSERIGRRVRVLGMQIHWWLTVDASVRTQFTEAPTSVFNGIDTPDSVGYVRVLVLVDRNANAAIPPITDILSSDSVFALRASPWQDRFSTLLDRNRPFIGTKDPIMSETFFCDCDYIAEWKDSSNTPVTNSVVVVLYAPSIVTNPVIGSCSTRIVYADE